MNAVTASRPSGRPGPVARLRGFGATLLRPQMSTAARERRDLIVLLAALALVVAPHVEHLPWWASGVLGLLWCWRLWLAVAQRPLPGRLAMLPLLAAAVGAVWLQYRTLAGRDAGTTFLLLLLALKLLELRARRDVYVIVFLAFFALLTQFLFAQGIAVALAALAAVLLLFFVLVSTHLGEQDLAARPKAALVGLLFVKSLPLAAALFLLFPRLDGPLWRMPGDAGTARSGLSNTMTPGAIGRLLESDEIAFRALFAGALPPPAERYWRGPVLGFFTGRSWTTLGAGGGAPALAAAAEPRYAYTVTLEPHQRDWLFALDLPVDLSGAADLAPRLRGDGQLIAGRLLTERVRYRLTSATRYTFDAGAAPDRQRAALQLPPGFNPRTRALAAELRQALAPGSGDLALVQAVLARFREQPFRYTLEPPILGQHAVDEFLFDTRAGFCEHYASAFVVLMRAAGIPARVVTGYLGGEFNPVDGFLTVRQADAHAWAEVWLAGRGWLRVDPTAAVAPERVERGNAGAAAAGAGGAAFGARSFDLLRALRFQWEALENGWNQWVLSYSAQRQRGLLDALGLAPDGRTLAQLFAAVTGAILLALALLSLRHRSEHDPLAGIAARLRARLAAAGVPAPAHLGPRALLAQVAPRLDAASAAEAAALLAEIEQLRYTPAGRDLPAARLRRLRARLRRYRPRIAPA